MNYSGAEFKLHGEIKKRSDSRMSYIWISVADFNKYKFNVNKIVYMGRSSVLHQQEGEAWQHHPLQHTSAWHTINSSLRQQANYNIQTLLWNFLA